MRQPKRFKPGHCKICLLPSEQRAEVEELLRNDLPTREWARQNGLDSWAPSGFTYHKQRHMVSPNNYLPATIPMEALALERESLKDLILREVAVLGTACLQEKVPLNVHRFLLEWVKFAWEVAGPEGQTAAEKSSFWKELLARVGSVKVEQKTVTVEPAQVIEVKPKEEDVANVGSWGRKESGLE